MHFGGRAVNSLLEFGFPVLTRATYREENHGLYVVWGTFLSALAQLSCLAQPGNCLTRFANLFSLLCAGRSRPGVTQTGSVVGNVFDIGYDVFVSSHRLLLISPNCHNHHNQSVSRHPIELHRGGV